MVAALVVTALALGLVPGAWTEHTASATGSQGLPCDGIVVVVDPAALSASTDGPSEGVVACAGRGASTAPPSDGLEVLRDAGVRVEGTAQWGAAFVCRVDGRPSASEEIVLPDGRAVTEPCDRTPSTDAYWSLWTADPGTDAAWTYAQTGVGDMALAPGAALGLVFSVGPDAPTPPAVSASDALAGRVGDGWTVRPSTDEGAAPAEQAVPDPHDSGDPLLLGVAAVLVLVLGGASVALARRRR